MTTETSTTSFASLGVSTPVVEALNEQGFTEAFPIQTATIQAALNGRDICGKAPTGSGKTLAFGIPVVDLCAKGEPWRPSALILSPTRELASQIKDELLPIAKVKGRTIATVFGGTNIERDIRQLKKGVDILVACPGRLEDLISRRCCELGDAELVVVDEADRMADMGFLPSVKRILDQTAKGRHTLLFSATLDGDVDTLIKRYQNNPLTYEIEDQVEESGDVDHLWYVIQPPDRISSAVAVLERYYSSIVFCRTRRGCDRVAKQLKKKGLSAVAIHGDRSQSQRERALADFTNGKAQVLVATDVAARGIHVDDVSLVMHYDPAGSDKDYIHRSGRTGRAGQDGRVISMVVEDKRKIARQLQKDLGMPIGFDDLDLGDLGAKAEPRKVVEPESKPQQKQQSKQGDRNNRSRGGDRSRGESGGGGSRNRNRDRNRSGNDRRDDERGSSGGGKNRSRDERSRDDRDDRKSGGGGKNRSRDERSRDDRDDRKSSGGGRSRDERSGRNRSDEDRNKSSRRGSSQRRRGKNDWYPKGYHDDEDSERGGRSRGSRSGAKRGNSRAGGGGGGRSADGDDRKRDDERPAGGRNTTQRKSRKAKGRHADQTSEKNKGKRRSNR